MIVFNTDLDNTLIYSYKHDIGMDKINVEIYEGREISFITKNTHNLLKQLKEKVLIVPTTTRTRTQYERIDLKIGNLKYALVCNGGILLEDGISNEEWYKESLDIISDSIPELNKAFLILQEMKERYFELRFIEELFIFTKCHEPEKVVELLKERLNISLVDIFNNGDKVYVVPINLNKGNAVKRFRQYMNADYIFAAGDSAFDISMVNEADYGIVPGDILNNNAALKETLLEKVHISEGKRLFAEDLLERILSI